MSRRIWRKSARVLIGLLWGGALFWAGLVGLKHENVHVVMAICPLAGGEFVILWMVADELCPRANVWISGLLKAITALIFWVAAAWSALLIWSNDGDFFSLLGSEPIMPLWSEQVIGPVMPLILQTWLSGPAASFA